MAQIEGDRITSRERDRERSAEEKRGVDRRSGVERGLDSISPIGVLGASVGAIAGVPPTLGYRAGSMIQDKFGITPTGPGSFGGEGAENESRGYGFRDYGAEGPSREELQNNAGVDPNSYAGRVLALQEDWLNYIRETGAPYIQAGRQGLEQQQNALGKIMAGPNYEAARNSPLFEQMRQQGEQAILAHMAKTGQVGSPGTAKLLGEMEQQNLVTAANQNYANQLAGYGAAGNLAQLGLQGLTGTTGAGGQTIGGIAGTYSGMQQQDYQNQAIAMNQAALDQQKNNMYLNAGIGVLGAVADTKWFNSLF